MPLSAHGAMLGPYAVGKMADEDTWTGRLIDDPSRREAWRRFVDSLHAATQPGCGLEGWLFHGTTADVASLVAYEGITVTAAVARLDGEREWRQAEGTHWALPRVAAFYAEDRIESLDDPGLDLAIVAVRMSDLEDCGAFSADGQTIDCPPYTRLGRPEAETDALWEGSSQDWRASLDILGTLLVLGPVPCSDVRILRSRACVEELLDELGASMPRP